LYETFKIQSFKLFGTRSVKTSRLLWETLESCSCRLLKKNRRQKERNSSKRKTKLDQLQDRNNSSKREITPARGNPTLASKRQTNVLLQEETKPTNSRNHNLPQEIRKARLLKNCCKCSNKLIFFFIVIIKELIHSNSCELVLLLIAGLLSLII
jgi:hypothetical protein